MPTKSNIAPLIDELGELRTKLKALEAREAEIKKLLKELGPGLHIGSAYTLTVTEMERDVLDMKAVREKLSAQFLRAHTATTTYLMLKTAKVADTDGEAA